MESWLCCFVLIPLFLVAGTATQTIVWATISIPALCVLVERTFFIRICGAERSWTTPQGVARKVSLARCGRTFRVARGWEAIVFIVLETFFESCQRSKILCLFPRFLRFGLSFGAFELRLASWRSQLGGDIEVSHAVIESRSVGCAVDSPLMPCKAIVVAWP